MVELTIFTPTYNRGKYLKQLYNSLKKQSVKTFEWIIVDDGSSDNTKEIVEKFDKSMFNIIYIYQKNSGKHIAFNLGVKHSNAPLFFCVDSDDILTSNAVEEILKYNEILNKKNIVGIIAYRKFPNEKISGNKFPDAVTITYNQLYYSYNKKGETALIFKTEILEKHPFPKFDKENFLSEEILYSQLDYEGNLLILPQAIYIMEYLENGLTNNWFKNWIKNPQATTLLLNTKYFHVMKLSIFESIQKKMKTLLQWNCFCIGARKSIFNKAPSRIGSVLLFLPSIPVYYLKFKQAVKTEKRVKK